MVKRIWIGKRCIVLLGICCMLAFAFPCTALEEALPLATVSFTEGPAVDAKGAVYFTDLYTSRILRYTPEEGLTVFRTDSNRANGLVFDTRWRLIACETGRVTRTDMATGKMEVIAEGSDLKQPNDVTLDSKGRIYFTDPEGKAVYRIDPDGSRSKILSAPDVELPNGIVITADDKTLYLVESNMLTEHGARMIRAYDLMEDGTVDRMRVFQDFFPGRSADGIAVDSTGNIYAAAGLNRTRGTGETLDTKPGIHVFSPGGELLKYYGIYEDTVTNCAFGGPDLKTLYVTAGKTLFSIRVDVEGTRR